MPIPDAFETHTTGLQSPATGGFAISPSNSADLAQVTRAVMLGVGGDLSVVFADGSAVVLRGLQAGVPYPLRLRRVAQTDTTAQDIVGLI